MSSFGDNLKNERKERKATRAEEIEKERSITYEKERNTERWKERKNTTSNKTV